MSHIVFDHITKSFGKTQVLRGISTAVPSNSITFIMGKSGCGKTTLLRILAGLETADSGEVYIAGKKITNNSPESRGVGMVFQNYALWPHLTVFKNISFPLEVRGVNKKVALERVSSLLAQLELTQLSSSFPHQLSGGQQQRVALGRALAISPLVLVLDEPFSNLDPSLRDDVRSVIKRVQQDEQIPIIIVSHDFEDVQAIGSDVVFMKEGIIVQTGTPEEIYENPLTLEVALSTGLVNFFPSGWVRPELCFLQEKNCETASEIDAIEVISIIAEEIAFNRGFIKIRFGASEYLVPFKRKVEIKVGDLISIGCYRSDVRER